MRIKISMQKLCFTFMLLLSTTLLLTAQPFGYVTTNSGVTVFKVADNSIVATIAISGTPSDIAITRDGSFAYITCSGDSTVKQLDLDTNMIVGTISLSEAPGYIAMTPDGKSTIVVSDNNVFKINLLDNSISATYTTPNTATQNLTGIAISPDSTTAYVARRTTGGPNDVDLLSFSVATLSLSNTLDLSSEFDDSTNLYDIALSPNGTKLYITSFNPNVVHVTFPSTIGKINLTGLFTSGLAFTPDGETIYVSENGGGNQVRPINVATNATGTPIPVGTNPQGIAVTPDGTKAFVANLTSGTTTPITIATGTAGTAFATGTGSAQIAITPPNPCEKFNFVPRPFNSIESKNEKFKTLDPIRYFWSDGARRFFIINREKDCPDQTKLMVLPFDTIEWDIANPAQGVLFDDGLKRVRSFNWIQDIGATGIIMAGVVNGVVGLE